MPFTSKDAEKHHKGLSAKQKKQWAAVANSVLASCQKKGSDNCDGVAIRTANGVVNNLGVNESDIKLYFQTTDAYSRRYETMQEHVYMVVPVVMMVEGVHSGSHGPVLHLANELGRFPESWNGIPVTINHPQNADGNYVSANSPDILESWAVGQIFNSRIDGDSLKAEAWIDVEKCQAISPETLQRISDGEILEVSVGVFSDEETSDGEFNGETYRAIARNHRPNHLAILPDNVGACSVNDGCGIRTNQKGGKEMDVIINNANVEQARKELATMGYIINESGFGELSNKAQMKLNSMDSATQSCYLEEMFENELVYKVYQYDPNGGGRSVKFFKQGYQENAAGDIEFTGEAVQVKRVVEYPVVPQTNVRVRTKLNVNQKGGGMDTKCSPCVKAAVDNLIANKSTAYQETDREWLEALSEEQLEKMHPQVNEVTKEEAIAILSSLSQDEYIETLPEVLRQQVKNAIQANKERKEKMVATITANAKHWTADELNAMSDDVLTKLYKTVNVNVDDDEDDQDADDTDDTIRVNAASYNDEREVEILLPLS
jgi:hypothetical protein